jgi:hypothetical protein
MFSVALNMLRQTLCRFAAPCPFHLPFPSFSDVAEARSYVAATAHKKSYCGEFYILHSCANTECAYKILERQNRKDEHQVDLQLSRLVKM